MQPLMAYNYGAGNQKRLKEVLKKLGTLTFTFGVVVTAGCFFARHTLIGMFLKDAEAATMGESLVIFLVIASPIVGFYYLSTSFLQACGSALPATIVSVLRQGGILIPSLYLMEHLLGFRGIAVAHTTADFLSVVIAVAVCIWQYRKIRKDKLHFAEDV